MMVNINVVDDHTWAEANDQQVRLEKEATQVSDQPAARHAGQWQLHLRRGLEKLGTNWSLFDLTPMGRQEEWEDFPPGNPQDAPYAWWRLNDSYA